MPKKIKELKKCSEKLGLPKNQLKEVIQNDNAIKSRHTANAVLKQAGLQKAFKNITSIFI